MSVPELHIRAFLNTDTQAVVDLWTTCGLVVPVNDPRRDIARKMAEQPELFLVGECDDMLVATLMVGYDGHRGWLNYLAVSPDLQRKGLGSRMLGEAERVLAERGCPKINLQVRKSNETMTAFYRANGYAVDEVIGMGKRLVDDADAPPDHPKD